MDQGPNDVMLDCVYRCMNPGPNDVMLDCVYGCMNQGPNDVMLDCVYRFMCCNRFVKCIIYQIVTCIAMVCVQFSCRKQAIYMK